MPELPEVETIKRSLSRHILERRICDMRITRRDLRFPIPPYMETCLIGRRIMALDRRGKYLLLTTDSSWLLLIHLGMSGRLTIRTADHDATTNTQRTQHDHAIFYLDNGLELVFNDPRRFGCLLPVRSEELIPQLQHLGPDPLEPHFNGQALEHALQKRRQCIRNALLDQRVIAGLGNIYVSEALYHASIDPCLPASLILGTRANKLVHAIRSVLNDALKAGGSSLRDYVDSSGALGYFQYGFSVYGRAGQACRRIDCRGKILRLRISGRSSFHCSLCQNEGYYAHRAGP